MRTSVEILHRSYFKNVYNSLDNSSKAQREIKKELEARLATGTTNNPIDVNNPNKNRIKVKREAGVQDGIDITEEITDNSEEKTTMKKTMDFKISQKHLRTDTLVNEVLHPSLQKE